MVIRLLSYHNLRIRKNLSMNLTMSLKQIFFLLVLVGMIVLPMPLVRYLKVWGIVIWLVWAGISIWWSLRTQRFQKDHDIHTYKEIVAFMDGKRLDELEKNQEIGKRPYQYFLFVLAITVIALAVVLLLRRLLFGF